MIINDTPRPPLLRMMEVSILKFAYHSLSQCGVARCLTTERQKPAVERLCASKCLVIVERARERGFGHIVTITGEGIIALIQHIRGDG